MINITVSHQAHLSACVIHSVPVQGKLIVSAKKVRKFPTTEAPREVLANHNDIVRITGLTDPVYLDLVRFAKQANEVCHA